MKKKLMAAVTTLGIMAISFTSPAAAHELSYKVISGDSLWKIAANNQLTVSQLMEYNRLTSSTIYVGQELTLLAPHTHEPATQPSALTHTVKSGDTLFLIAQKYSITVTELKTINKLTTDNIYIGQVLNLTNQTSNTIEPPINAKSYTVKSGDTLWKIATNYQLTVSELKSFNNLTTDYIYVGQVLQLTSQTTNNPPASQIKPTINADALITEAKKYIGVPYVWGGSTPVGFDCSGYLNYVFNSQGITIPRTVETIWAAATPVSTPQPGDLVFFTTYAPGASHAGIYIGDNKFIHAVSSTGVTITDMNNTYWKPRYLGAKAIK
jgi:cell wall-associated NlpC family hydrolase